MNFFLLLNTKEDILMSSNDLEFLSKLWKSMGPINCLVVGPCQNIMSDQNHD